MRRSVDPEVPPRSGGAGERAGRGSGSSVREEKKAEATSAARERSSSDSNPAAVNSKRRHQAVRQAAESKTGSEFDRARQALAAFTLTPNPQPQNPKP